VWVPRDVWSPVVGHRINHAFDRGGFPRLLAALWYLGLPATHGLVIGRAATERLAEQLDVTVPVDEPLRFRYPTTPTRPIEEGEVEVAFDPPEARLRGTRIHQWAGARYEVGRPGSDLRRIVRQQVLLQRLLRTGAPLGTVLDRAEDVRRFGTPEVVLRRVEPGWAMRTLGPVTDATHGGAAVLATPSAARRLGRRLRARVLRSPR
jgi:hypothetical protein